MNNLSSNINHKVLHFSLFGGHRFILPSPRFNLFTISQRFYPGHVDKVLAAALKKVDPMENAVKVIVTNTSNTTHSNNKHPFDSNNNLDNICKPMLQNQPVNPKKMLEFNSVVEQAKKTRPDRFNNPEEQSLIIYSEKENLLSPPYINQYTIVNRIKLRRLLTATVSTSEIYYAGNTDGRVSQSPLLSYIGIENINNTYSFSGIGYAIVGATISLNNNLEFNTFNNNIYTPVPTILRSYITAYGIPYESYLNSNYILNMFRTIEDLKDEALKRQLIKINKSPCVNVREEKGNIVIAGDKYGMFSFTKDGYAFYNYLQERQLISIQMPITTDMRLTIAFQIKECDLIVIKSEIGNPAIKTAMRTHILTAYNPPGKYLYAFMDLTSKNHGVITTLSPIQFTKFQDLEYGKIFTAEEENKLHNKKAQNAQFFENIMVIPREYTHVLAKGNKYLNSFNSNIKAECNLKINKLFKQSFRKFDSEAFSKHDLLEMIKIYDYFAENNRSNFPKTEEQIIHSEKVHAKAKEEYLKKKHETLKKFKKNDKIFT